MKELYTDKSSINGTGLFIKDKVHKGDKIAYISGDVHVFREFTSEISEKMLDWIGVGRFSWIDTSNSMFRFINHSCDPNVVITGTRTVIAYKDISPKSEITMDYSLTEAEPGWKIENCMCGAKNCRGTILPIYKLDKATIRKYLPYISRRFKKVYETKNGTL